MKSFDYISYPRACMIMGKGDFQKGKSFWFGIAEAMQIAREKHPVFAEGKYHALGVICEEVHELERAVEQEGRERQIAEAIDVMVTCARFILGEHESESTL